MKQCFPLKNRKRLWFNILEDFLKTTTVPDCSGKLLRKKTKTSGFHTSEWSTAYYSYQLIFSCFFFSTQPIIFYSCCKSNFYVPFSQRMGKIPVCHSPKTPNCNENSKVDDNLCPEWSLQHSETNRKLRYAFLNYHCMHKFQIVTINQRFLYEEGCASTSLWDVGSHGREPGELCG